MTPEQEREEVRKAIKAASANFTGFGNYTNADIYLAINASSWLRNALDREEQLIAENQRIADLYNRDVYTLEAKVAEQDKEIERLNHELMEEESVARHHEREAYKNYKLLIEMKAALERIVEAYGWGDAENYAERMHNEAKAALDSLNPTT